VGDYTQASVYWLYALMAFFATGALFFLARALRSGAVADDESPKYRMLEDDLPAPRAAAGGDGGRDAHQA
jgi:hypothetical protein